VTTTRATLYSIACNFVVGAAPQPTGTLVVALLFPFFPPPGETALDVVDVQRAIDAANNVRISRVKLGKSSYFDLDNSTLTVAVSKKFAFTLQWVPTGALGGGSTLTSALQAKLTGVARSVVARTPRRER
jgi:hypothetical protein